MLSLKRVFLFVFGVFFCSIVVVFTNLSNYICEYSVTITDRYDGQNCENKTQVVINRNYPLSPVTSVA